MTKPKPRKPHLDPATLRYVARELRKVERNELLVATGCDVTWRIARKHAAELVSKSRRRFEREARTAGRGKRGAV